MSTSDAFGCWWPAAVRAAPHRPALRFEPDGVRLTRAELDGLLRRFAAAWAARGLVAGDRVLVDCGGDLAIPAVFGAMALGLVPICLPPDAPAALRQAAAGHARAELELGEELVAEIEGRRPLQALPELDPEADAAILFSSGTTGAARACRLSHRALHAAARVYPDLREFGPEARVLVATGPYTVTGLRYGLPIPALQDAEVVSMPRLTRPREAWETAARLGCHQLTGGPGLLAALLADPAPLPLGPVVVVVGGGGVGAEERRRFAARFGVRVRNSYGLTETAGAVGHWTSTAEEDRWTTLPGVRIEAPTDAPGPIRVRSPAAFSGYLGGGGPVEGWVETGDLGQWVEGGLRVLGRGARMLTTASGEKVLLDEVEGVLREISGALSYVGLAGDLVALVEAWGPAAERALAERLPGRARPRRILVGPVPRSPNGKVDTVAAQAKIERG